MKTDVIRKFGMKTGADDRPLSHTHDLPLVFAELFDNRAHSGYNWRADKDAHDWLGKASDRNLVFKAVDLSAESVPAYGDVEEIERILAASFDFGGEHDHSHARSPKRHSRFPGVDQRITQSVSLHEQSNRRAFASREDGAIYRREFFGSSNFSNIETLGTR